VLIVDLEKQLNDEILLGEIEFLLLMAKNLFMGKKINSKILNTVA
jgi:hypothetical protein